MSEFFPEICSPMLDVSSGVLVEKYDEVDGSREAGTSCCARLSVLLGIAAAFDAGCLRMSVNTATLQRQ